MKGLKMCFLIVLLTLLAAGCRGEETKLLTTGNVEAEEVRVVAEVAGTLSEILVEEGEQVHEGQVVAKLSSPELEAGKQKALAAYKMAQAKLAEVKAGSRDQEIAAARQKVKALQAQVEAAQVEYNLQKSILDKYRHLAEQGAITEHELELQESKVEQLHNNLVKAKATLGEAQSGLELLLAGARTQTVEQFQAQVEAAKADLQLAEVNLAKTTLRAPKDGTVLTCNFEVGEKLMPGAEVMTIGDTSNLFIYTYVPEDRLSQVKTGQEVRIAVDSYPDKTFAGRVTYIAPEAEFTPKNVQTKEDRVRLVFKVKIKVVDAEDELRPGMPADVIF